MTKKEEKAQEREEAIRLLRETFPPGSTASTVLRHVSRSGMLRVISVVACCDGVPEDLSWAVARVTGYRFDRDHGGVRISGCGMDMGFQLVYQLSSYLYPEGFGCVGEGDGRSTRCPSNDHSNGDRDYTPHRGGALHSPGDSHLLSGAPIPSDEARKAGIHWHESGGYAIRHRWI